MKNISCFTFLLTSVIVAIFSSTTYAQQSNITNPCPFDKHKTCTLQRDILNDVAANGLMFYGSTNYDDRQLGQLSVYRNYLVSSYANSNNIPGQIRLAAQRQRGNPSWYSGEIMTRSNLDKSPWYSSHRSNAWSTKDAGSHGYLEVTLKTPLCEKSDDEICGSDDPAQYLYSSGLLSSIKLVAWNDSNATQNGEITLMEAYRSPFNGSDTIFRFQGYDEVCMNRDCEKSGYILNHLHLGESLYLNFHTWGFEWQADTDSKQGGVILTGYFDGKKTWGPLRTDTLPADGAHAFSRGFNDPNGGYYLIVSLAINNNPLAVNSHVKEAAMYLQSAKAYIVND